MLSYPTSTKIIAIVPAAGIGARAALPDAPELPKQYQMLAGKPMLWHAVNALLQDVRVEQVLVSVAPEDSRVQQALQGLPRTTWRHCGGATRAQTVLNSLLDAKLAEHDWVLVHDAARPGLPKQALTRLIDACLGNDVGGLLALPVADTLKQGDACVLQTVPREHLWLAQTPQMFRAGLLLSSLTEALERGVNITDEASALEAAGFSPILVPGSGRNVKVTWPEDFAWVESWL
jgi:2-C-methyl-D-erythritol 4-phosphate cytidylyltransferase